MLLDDSMLPKLARIVQDGPSGRLSKRMSRGWSNMPTLGMLHQACSASGFKADLTKDRLKLLLGTSVNQMLVRARDTAVYAFGSSQQHRHMCCTEAHLSESEALDPYDQTESDLKDDNDFHCIRINKRYLSTSATAQSSCRKRR